jgi:predicted Zn-dependent protease
MRIRGIALVLVAVSLGSWARAEAGVSWNGYHWATTGQAVTVLSDLGPRWTRTVSRATDNWSSASAVTLQPQAFSGACEFQPGAIRVCGTRYGQNAWLAQTDLWVSNDGVIKAALVRVNLSYFRAKRYDNVNTKLHTLCHELGHAVGLDHEDTVSCMNPSAPLRKAAYAIPSADDLATLVAVYAAD